MEAWRQELYENRLCHSALGTSWGRHAYVAKEKVNGKWVYFYTFKDYEMFKNSTAKKHQPRIPERDYKEPAKASKKSTSSKSKPTVSSGAGQTTTSSDKKSSKKGSSKTSKGATIKAKATTSKSSSSTGKKTSTKEASSSKKEKAATEKTTKTQVVKEEKARPTNPVSLNFLKNVFNIQENETKQRDSNDPQMLESEMTKDYNDGSYGYLVVETPNGTETFRWQKYDGKVTLKAFDSETPLTFAQLPKSTNMIDLRVDNKRK